ncbi:MAG: DUF2141 domain-containing protein [Treponema sp.]|jgi:uncharacterized protein (DUF2141 family)|nr:DUF2141 domain-containing protein [Treponema sp.]
MKKPVIFFLLSFAFCGLCFSQAGNTVNVTVEVNNIVVNGGKVYLVIFLTDESFKKEEPEIAFELQDDKVSISKEISLARREYVVFAFQDANNNRKLDYGFLGIPKEIVGISNYFGKGFPTKSYDKQKILIDEKTGKITIGLYKF